MKCSKPELQTFRHASSGTGVRPRSASGTPRGTLAAQPPTIIVLFTSRKDAFGAAGAQREMGPRLPDIFADAGLPRPDMIAGQKITSRLDPDLHAIIAGLARSLLPVMEKAKIVTAEEIDLVQWGVEIARKVECQKNAF